MQLAKSGEIGKPTKPVPPTAPSVQKPQKPSRSVVPGAPKRTAEKEKTKGPKKLSEKELLKRFLIEKKRQLFEDLLRP